MVLETLEYGTIQKVFAHLRIHSRRISRCNSIMSLREELERRDKKSRQAWSGNALCFVCTWVYEESLSRCSYHIFKRCKKCMHERASDFCYVQHYELLK